MAKQINPSVVHSVWYRASEVPRKALDPPVWAVMKAETILREQSFSLAKHTEATLLVKENNDLDHEDFGDFEKGSNVDQVERQHQQEEDCREFNGNDFTTTTTTIIINNTIHNKN